MSGDLYQSIRSPHRRPQIALLGATLQAKNLGVGALAVGAIQCLLGSFPEADIYLLDYAKEPSVHTLNLDGKDIRIPLINMRFSKRFYLSNNIAMLIAIAAVSCLFPSKKVREWLLSRNATLRQIARMDLIASIAGGDSFSDIYGLPRLLYVSLPQMLALLIRKPLLLLPQTIGPFRGALANRIARFIMSRATGVYSREKRSLTELNKLAASIEGSQRVEFSYDVGFLLNPIAPPSVTLAGFESLRQVAPVVALNVSGLLLMGGYSRKNMFNLRADYRQLVYDMIELLIRRLDMSVLLLPHVFSEAPESDMVACEQFFNQLEDKYNGRLGLLRGEYNQHEIKFIIGQCDFLIGARMHACIAAVSQCIPAVCIAYSDKFIGVMETLGIEDIVVDSRELDRDEILRAIDRAVRNREKTRQILQSNMPTVKSSILKIMGDVNDPETEANINAGCLTI